MHFHVQLLPILGLHLRSIYASPIPGFKPALLEVSDFSSHMSPTSEILNQGGKCARGGCSAAFSERITPADLDTHIPIPGTKEDRPLFTEEKLPKVEEIKTAPVTPVKQSRFVTFTKPVRSIIPRLRKSIQGFSFVRQQWFKFTLQTENSIIEHLNGLKYVDKYGEIIPDLVGKITEIQEMRTALNKVYGVGHISDELKNRMVLDMAQKTDELNTYINDQRLKIIMAEGLNDNGPMMRVFARIKNTEGVELESFPTLRSEITDGIAQLQKSRTFPPGRDGVLALFMSMLRSKPSIEQQWTAYRAGYEVVTRAMMKELAEKTNVPGLKELAEEASVAMQHEKDAGKAIETVSDYDKYLQSTHETITAMRKISNFLRSETDITTKSTPALRQYFQFQGVSKGPITFALIKDTLPGVYRDVEKILADVAPPKGWKTLGISEEVPKPPVGSSDDPLSFKWN